MVNHGRVLIWVVAWLDLPSLGSLWASQMVLMVKNLPANAGNSGDAGYIHIYSFLDRIDKEMERKWKVLFTQSCSTLWDPMHCSPPGSSVHRILQARMLEWVAIPFSRGFSQPRDQPGSPALQAHSLSTKPPGKPRRLESLLFIKRQYFYISNYVSPIV